MATAVDHAGAMGGCGDRELQGEAQGREWLEQVREQLARALPVSWVWGSAEPAVRVCVCVCVDALCVPSPPSDSIWREGSGPRAHAMLRCGARRRASALR